jgi:hypothetical protein
MKILIILIFLLVGCATTKIPDAVLPPVEKTVRIDPRIFELCDPLKNLPENASFEDVLAITISNFEIYSTCSIKQSKAVKLLKEFSNYKEP